MAADAVTGRRNRTTPRCPSALKPMKKLLLPLVVVTWTGCATSTSKPSAQFQASGGAGGLALMPPSSRPGDPRSQALLNHPEWTAEVQEWVKHGQLGQAMPAEAVQASWGTPSEKKKSNFESVAKEEWVYSYPKDPVVSHLFFENGMLKSWTQNK